jgi:hypothetical protein
MTSLTFISVVALIVTALIPSIAADNQSIRVSDQNRMLLIGVVAMKY